MSRLRAPVFAGIGCGAGTSTLAAALHGHDGGRCRMSSAGGWAPDPGVDVLVCRATPESLARAADALPGRPPPVLAVVATGPDGPLPLPGWLRDLERRFSAVVAVPHVQRYRRDRPYEDPLAAPAALLGRRPEQRPRGSAPYVEALLELTSELMTSGRLEADRVVPPRRADPPVARPVAGPVPVRRIVEPPRALTPAPLRPLRPPPQRTLWRGLQAVERLPRARPPARPGDELDDEQLEDGRSPALAARSG